MNERTDRRHELGLTQVRAAERAGLSLATWRRWEEDPQSVGGRTRDACEQVLEMKTDLERALAKSAAAFEKAWGRCPDLTPRQAYAIAITLDFWADTEISEWIRRPDEPLHQIMPFDIFDLRVMMLVGESRAWAEAVRERCCVLSEEIEQGVLPFDRPGPYIDEVLIGAAFSSAQERLSDTPDPFERIAPRTGSGDDEDEDYLIGDDDWDAVGDDFEDRCQWDDWRLPLIPGNPLLPIVLADRHPFSWFNEVPPSGHGYLRRLAGMVVEGADPRPGGRTAGPA